MSIKKREFQLDLSRYLCLETGELYTEDFNFSLPSEELVSFKQGDKLKQEIEKGMEVDKKLITNFYQKQRYSVPKQSLARQIAIEFAYSRLRYQLASPGESLDVDTWSDASIVETERWWQVLETVQAGDWSLLRGELEREAHSFINAAREMYGSKPNQPDNILGAELQKALIERDLKAFHFADYMFEKGTALNNLVQMLEENRAAQN